MKRSITRRKVRRRLAWVVGLAVLAALLIADRAGWLLVRRVDDMAAYHGMQTRITAVLDGDTIEVALPDALHDRPTTRVRLCGLDCPEPARARQEAEPWAEEAAALCRALTEDATITLWLEPQRTRGVFGRVLAHVQLPDGSSLNEALLAAGLAAADDRWPHAYLTRYAQLEHVARRKSQGIWSEEETAGEDD
jgi:micrococcal nuclease